MSLLLGVNVDHVATLRQARYAGMHESELAEPSPLQASIDAKAGGADSITIHVRGDRRHMQDSDAFRIRTEQSLPLNFEMGVTSEMIDFALKLKPDYACFVPETREEVTTEGGLDLISNFKAIEKAVDVLQQQGIVVSLFIDPDEKQVLAAAQLKAKMIELHTGAFANTSGEKQQEEIKRLKQAAILGNQLGLQINAGHGINYHNIKLLWEIPHLTELNIGHSIVARSLSIGFESAVSEMKKLMATYPGSL